MTNDIEELPGMDIGPGKMVWYMTLQAIVMVGIAVVAGLIWKPPFWSMWAVDWRAMFLGTALAVVLVAVGILVEKLPIWPFTRLRQDLEKMMPLFRGGSLPQLLWISVCAGVSEEVALRGCLEPILRGYVGTVSAVVITAVLFGALHALSAAYALTIAFVSVLFSLLMLHTDNLVAPIVAHSVYDFLTLAHAVKTLKTSGAEEPEAVS